MRTLFLGDVGNHLDIADTKRDVEQVRRSMRGSAYHQRAVDAAQDKQITALQEEIEDLQMTVAALARVLVASGVVSTEEMERLVGMLDS